MILLGPTSPELRFSAFDISSSIRLKDSRDHHHNACGEMMSGWQDSFMLNLALQPVGSQLPIGHKSVGD